MTDPDFDADGLFDEDYLHFYTGVLGDERSDSEVELIWQLLELEPGMAVLDLACGHGRIANRLAARGCEVTGLDSSTVFLDRARADAAARKVSVDYVPGDMRDLPWTGRFDRVVNWFTAFGYFDDAGNREVLTQVARALRPGGRLALDLNNLVAVLRSYQTSVVFAGDGGDLVVDQHRLDPLTGRNVVQRTMIRDNRVRRVPYFIRMLTFPELRDWLLAAGFTEVAGYGEDGTSLTAEHRRMVAVARLP